MKKRFLPAVLFVAMTVSLVTGCVGLSSNAADTRAESAKVEDTKADGGAEAKKEDTQVTSGEYATLTVMDGYTLKDPHGQYIYQYVEGFMKENPDIKMEIQAIAPGDIYTKLAAMAASPDDLPTMFSTSAGQVLTLYDLGLTEDLANWMGKEAIDGLANGVMDACTINGQMAYCPVVVQPQAVIYRIDHFEEAGPEIPATWSEFVDCVKALTKDSGRGGQVDQRGFPVIDSSDSPGQSRFMSYLWSSEYKLAYQEDDLDEWETDIITDPAFVNVFSKWIDMSNVEGVVPTDITEVGCFTVANYFAMGYASMFPTGPNAPGVAYANNSELKEGLGSFKPPGECSGIILGTEGYVIITKSTGVQKAAAAKYLEFLTSHGKDMKFWGSSGKTPPTTEGQKVSYITGDDYAGSSKQIEDDCCPTLASAEINGLKSVLDNAYAAVFSNERTDGQAVEQLVKDFSQLLENYG